MTVFRRGLRVIGYCSGMAIILASLAAPCAPALGFDPVSYFSLSYSISVDRAALYPGDSVTATISGTATCTADLPLPVSEAAFSGRVIARNASSGESIVVNPGYEVSIGSFPRKAGQSVTAGCTVVLQFPPGAAPGLYDIIGELTSARVKAVLWFDVSSYLPDSETLGSLTIIAHPPEPPEPPEPAAPPVIVPPGTTSLNGRIDEHGVVLENVSASSVENACTLTLLTGTTALDGSRFCLRELFIAPSEKPQPAPPGLNSITIPYDLGPERATFSPPALLSLRYAVNQIPDGVKETDLFIAYWDKTALKWVELDGCTVDVATHTISARVPHLSTYGVMAHTAAASFSVSSLVITPGDIALGQTVSVATTVTNSGDFSGSYVIRLSVNYEIKQTREITLAGKSSQQVVFNLTPDTAGSFIIGLNESRGMLSVKNPAEIGAPPLTSPASASAASSAPAPTQAGANPPVTSSPAGASPGTEAIPVLVRMQPVSDTSFFWWLGGGILVGMLSLVSTFAGSKKHPRPDKDAIMLDIPD